jgi:hypothetical protein
MKKLVRVLLVLVAVYGGAAGLFYWQMTQPPQQFAAVMGRLPMVTMMIFPFEPLWNRARAGAVQIGDPAPDFNLETVDHQSRVQLSSHRGVRPVLLVFGSYT